MVDSQISGILFSFDFRPEIGINFHKPTKICAGGTL